MCDLPLQVEAESKAGKLEAEADDIANKAAQLITDTVKMLSMATDLAIEASETETCKVTLKAIQLLSKAATTMQQAGKVVREASMLACDAAAAASATTSTNTAHCPAVECPAFTKYHPEDLLCRQCKVDLANCHKDLWLLIQNTYVDVDEDT
jgi:hypothetical protein